MSILSDLTTARDKAVAAANILHNIVHGPASGAASLVATDAGNVKTMARLAAEIDDAVQNGLTGPQGSPGVAGPAGPAGAIGQVLLMSAAVTPANCVAATGGLVSRATWPSLWSWVNTNSLWVLEASWTKRRWSNGDTATTFRVPDLRGHFPRFADGPNGAAAGIDKTSLKGDTVNGSTAVSNLAKTDFMYVGMPVSGAGIPLGATVATITSGTAITLSAAATATAVQVWLSFTGREFWSIEDDAIRNITGDLATDALLSGNGAFAAYSDVSGGLAGGGSSPSNAVFDASRVVPIAPENRPVNMAFWPVIVAA